MRVSTPARLPLSERARLVNPPPGAFAGTEVAVVLPTLNEEAGLEATYRRIPFDEFAASGWKIRPLVVDGGSTDGTIAIAERLGLQVLHQRSSGKGGAVREALEWLREAGVSYAVMLDADTTYPGEMVGRVVGLLRAGTGFVVGIRQPIRTEPAALRDLIHRTGNAILNYVAGQLSRHPILDLCSGFWGLDLRLEAGRHLRSSGFEVEAELFLSACRTGARVVQIPIPYTDRVGEAKLRALHDGGRILVTILRQADPFFGSPADFRATSTPPFREVLAACFVHGATDVVVVADKSRRAEAQEILDRFIGTRVTPSLVLRPGPVTEVGEPPALGATATRRAIRITLSTPTPEESERPLQTEILLPGEYSSIRLRLLPHPAQDDPPAGEPRASPAWISLSGGYALRSGAGGQGPGRGFVRSMLAAPGIDQELQFLFANGLAATLVPSASSAPTAGALGSQVRVFDKSAEPRLP
jgi:dolichol-phosphate hexosyltransferase